MTKNPQGEEGNDLERAASWGVGFLGVAAEKAETYLKKGIAGRNCCSSRKKKKTFIKREFDVVFGVRISRKRKAVRTHI